MQGVLTPPAVAFEQLEELAHTLDEDADFLVRAMGEQGSAAAALIAAIMTCRHREDCGP